MKEGDSSKSINLTAQVEARATGPVETGAL